MLPGPGFWSGSVLLLPAHPQEHHQADLLLQPSGEGLGNRLPEVPILRIWWVSRESAAGWVSDKLTVLFLTLLDLFCLLQWPLRRSVLPVLGISTPLQP